MTFSAFGALIALSALCANAATLYVSPDGNDTHSGKSMKPDNPDGPLASLQGAREAIRKLKAAGALKDPLAVIVADGLYTLADPLVFTPDDSGAPDAPIIYQAAAGATPVFSGGTKISGFKPTADGLWSTTVPGVKEGKWYFEQIWVNSNRAQRAPPRRIIWKTSKEGPDARGGGSPAGAARLYYRPLAGEDPAPAEVIAPRLTELIRLEGEPQEKRYVEHITLRGLSFQHAQW